MIEKFLYRIAVPSIEYIVYGKLVDIKNIKIG
jgi:hypothetical protein